MFDHIETLSIKGLKCFHGNLDEGCKISLKVLSRSKDINIIQTEFLWSEKFSQNGMYTTSSKGSATCFGLTEADTQRCSQEKLFWKQAANLQEQTKPEVYLESLAKSNTYMKREIHNIPWWFFFIKGQVWKLLQMLETHVFNNYFENLISTLPGREIMLFLVKRTKISNFRRYS